MAAESICDGCGKRAPMTVGAMGTWHKPRDWYERTDFGEGDGEHLRKPVKNYTACCRACIEKIAKDTKTTAVVAPF